MVIEDYMDLATIIPFLQKATLHYMGMHACSILRIPLEINHGSVPY